MRSYFRRSCMCVLLSLAASGAVLAQQTTAPTSSADERPATQAQVQELRQLVMELKAQVALLTTELRTARAERAASDAGTGTATAAATITPADGTTPGTARSRSGDAGLPDWLRGTTFSADFDGYYSYNFNRPAGGINLLRAYDVTSRSFNINQAGTVIERAPDVAGGRRWGVRVDLMYGQATESVQGNPLNEQRPWVWRPLFQAYGSYVAPIGSGLRMDFGKWASSLGYEGNYTKDQINYSRSLLFDLLPFYHMGLRTAYDVNSRLALSYWLVNGINQTEDFNPFKSHMLGFTAKPSKAISWTVNYHVGREQRAVAAATTSHLPALPTPFGLSLYTPADVPRGRLHILDSYAAWEATPQLLLVGEADYVVNRIQSNSPPSHAEGGAAYARYRLAPNVFLGGRFEYINDIGGMFSGKTAALKESTLTATYQIADGFQTRLEYRRDFSNRALFLTSNAANLKKEQNTLTLGLVWWFGGKEGAW